MSPFRGTDDAGRVAEPLGPENLRGLLQQAPTFVVVQSASWGPDHVTQASREDGERWRLEVRSGGPQRHVFSYAPNTDAAFDMVRSWCAADGWWQDAFTWEPLSGT